MQERNCMMSACVGMPPLHVSESCVTDIQAHLCPDMFSISIDKTDLLLLQRGLVPRLSRNL